MLNGLTLGSIYGLVALGLTLVYGILHVPNFAHGALYMVGAYVAYFTMVDMGLNYWLAMIAAGAVVAILSVLCERLVFHPLRHAPPIHTRSPPSVSCCSWRRWCRCIGARISAACPHPIPRSCISAVSPFRLNVC
ncbi:branched-chain amino acid ABC transporter permease [Alloalcanivorax xenomutans]|uniref:branched-chain amino acid ABC transporter permease n=1 Tax=Alloalcanivorax xenomutans TaxID=1094342 RepID=UPI003A809C03